MNTVFCAIFGSFSPILEKQMGISKNVLFGASPKGYFRSKKLMDE